MDTKKYAVVEKVVEKASLTRAAEELGLTQSGVSHIVAPWRRSWVCPFSSAPAPGRG